VRAIGLIDITFCAGSVVTLLGMLACGCASSARSTAPVVKMSPALTASSAAAYDCFDSSGMTVGLCPKCGADDSLPIAYGLASTDMMDAMMRGEYVLGGCCFQYEDRHGKRCGHEWDADGDG
jgi:hypothetical protein